MRFSWVSAGQCQLVVQTDPVTPSPSYEYLRYTTIFLLIQTLDIGTLLTGSITEGVGKGSIGGLTEVYHPRLSHPDTDPPKTSPPV